MERLQSLEFVRDPGLVAQLLAIGSSFLHGMNITVPDNRIAVGIEVCPANAILTIVLEIAQGARTVDFGSHQRRLDGRTGTTQIHRGLFTTLDPLQHIGNPFVLIEIPERF